MVIQTEAKKIKTGGNKGMKKIFTILTLMMFATILTIAVIFPELFSTTAKASLKRDIDNGNKKAIEYYNNTYEKYNIKLFD